MRGLASLELLVLDTHGTDRKHLTLPQAINERNRQSRIVTRWLKTFGPLMYIGPRIIMGTQI